MCIRDRSRITYAWGSCWRHLRQGRPSDHASVECRLRTRLAFETNDAAVGWIPRSWFVNDLCKVGPGGVAWLDFGCGGNLNQQIANPCNKAFDIPIWIPTSPGNPNAVENEVNAYAGKVVLIPLFDSTCRTIPASGLTQNCTDPGNGKSSSSSDPLARPGDELAAPQR